MLVVGSYSLCMVDREIILAISLWANLSARTSLPQISLTSHRCGDVWTGLPMREPRTVETNRLTEKTSQF